MVAPAGDAPGPPGPRKGACSRAYHHPIPLAATCAMVGGVGSRRRCGRAPAGPFWPVARVARDALACLPLRASLGWHSKRRGGAGGGEVGRGMLGRRAGPLQSRGPVLGGGAAAACAAACRVGTFCATQRQAIPVHSAPAAAAPPRILSLSSLAALLWEAWQATETACGTPAWPYRDQHSRPITACPRQPEARCQTRTLHHGTGELNGIFLEMTGFFHSNFKAMF